MGDMAITGQCECPGCPSRRCSCPGCPRDAEWTVLRVPYQERKDELRGQPRLWAGITTARRMCAPCAISTTRLIDRHWTAIEGEDC